MYNRIKHIITFLWPTLECLILATLIGYKINHELALIIVIFIFMIAINFIYKHGYVIRILGWGVYGLLLGTRFFYLNGVLFLIWP